MFLTEAGSQDLARMDGQQALPGDLPVPAFLVLELQVHVIVSGCSSKEGCSSKKVLGLKLLFLCLHSELFLQLWNIFYFF